MKDITKQTPIAITSPMALSYLCILFDFDVRLITMTKLFKKIFSPKNGSHNYYPIKIINESSKFIPLNLEKIILELLKVVPNEHLIGLESISLVDKFPEKQYKDALGTYSQKHGLNKARIEISVEYLSSYEPYVLRLIPFLGKYYLAKVLFHEIGHHYRHCTHGITKNENEKFADEYQKKFIKKAFYHWRYILKPLKPLIVWSNKFINKREFLEDSERGE